MAAPVLCSCCLNDPIEKVGCSVCEGTGHAIYDFETRTKMHNVHNHIERNGIQIKYGETVLVEVDKLSILLADRQAYRLNLATLTLEKCEKTEDQLPFFIEMTYSAELLSYHNWRNRIIHRYGFDDGTQQPGMLRYMVYRLHRISYNEFAWIKLEPINISDFKATYAVLRKPYEWEQLFGLRIRPENLKGMGMPREESSMRPINLMEYFQAVGST